MTDTRTGYNHQRTYTREGDELTDTVYVNVTADGHIRMSVHNIDAVLKHLGYTETTKGHENG